MPHAIAGKRAEKQKGQHILLKDDGRGLWIPRGILGGRGGYMRQRETGAKSLVRRTGDGLVDRSWRFGQVRLVSEMGPFVGLAG